MNIFTKLKTLSPHDREFFIRYLPQILAENGNVGQFTACLMDFDYLSVRLCEIEVREIINEYGLLYDKNSGVDPHILAISEKDPQTATALKLIQKTLQQSVDILSQDTHQLPSILLSKLLPLNNFTLTKFLDHTKNCQLYPWLQPLTVGLSNPTQPIINTIATEHQGRVEAVAISGDGKWALSSEQRDSDRRSRKEADIFKVWNLSNGSIKQILNIQKVQEYDPHDHGNSPTQNEVNVSISALALSFNGRWAVAGGIAAGQEGPDQAVVELWDLATGESLIQFIPHKWNISALAVSENGQQIVVGLKEGDLQVWLLNDQKSKILDRAYLNNAVFYSFRSINAIALSPDGRWFVAGDDIFLSLWDLAKGKLVQCIRTFSKVSLPKSNTSSRGQVASIKALALDSKGKVTALFEDGILKVWNFEIPQNSQNISFEHGIKKLKQKSWERIYYLVYIRQQLGDFAFCVFMFFFEKFSYFKPVRKWISGVIINCLELLNKQFRFYSSSRGESILLQLALLWKSVQAFSRIKAETFRVDGLETSAPASITPDTLDDNNDHLQLAVSTNKIGNLKILDLRDAQPILSWPKKFKTKRLPSKQILSSELQEPWGQAIATSLDGNWVFSSPRSKVLEMWDITDQEKQRKLNRKRNSSCRNIDLVAKSLNGRWVFLISGHTFDVIDLAKTFSGWKSHWLLKEVSSNGSWGLWQSGARTLRLTNLKTGKIIGELHDYYEDLDGSESWKASKDKNWREINWSYETSKDIFKRISISANGDSVLMYSHPALEAISLQKYKCLRKLYCNLILWDVKNNRVKIPFSKNKKPHSKSEDERLKTNTKFMLTSDGDKALFGLENGELKFCTLSTDRLIHALEGHTKEITAVAISQDDQWAASSSLDQTLKIWNLQLGTLIATYTAESRLYSCRIMLTPERRIFVTASDETKKVHAFQLQLPIDYYSALQKSNNSIEVLEKDAETLTPELQLSLISWQSGLGILLPLKWQFHFSIPLPLSQLTDLPISLTSEVGIDYTHLQELLKKGQWKEADKETQLIMRGTINREIKDFNTNDAQYFPETDLLTIDRLWLNYSHGRYGFSLQMVIWPAFQNDYSLFLRVLGRGLFDNKKPCENVRLRKGHFPYLIHLSNSTIAVPLFIRLAECFGYQDWSKEQERVHYKYYGKNYEIIPTKIPELELSKPEPFEETLTTEVSETEIAIAHPPTIPYQFQIKGIPGQSAYININIQGEGLLEVTLWDQQERINKWQLTCNNNTEDLLLTLPLPPIPWKNDLIGQIIFKSLEEEILCQISFTVICPLDSLEKLNKLNSLKHSSSLYRLLETQKRLLGEYHLDVEQTLESLIQSCKQNNRYAEAESFKIQKQKIQDQRIKVPIEGKEFRIILLLSPDEIVT